MWFSTFVRTGLAAGLCLSALPIDARAQAADPVPQTVTVSAKKAAVVKKLDKTVYDVSDAPQAANGSAQDLLQATPELSVTADGRIAVKGNTQVTVLVDGKPTAMLSGSPEERAVALQTMSGADIAGIEVITNPSAAYNANGGAIVNIVLKRNRKPGAHAQLQGAASSQGLWRVGASGDATANTAGTAFSVHGNLALRHDGNEKVRASTVDWINPHSGATGQTSQTSDVFVHRIVETAGLGADYRWSDADSVSLATSYNARRSHPLFDVLNADRSGAAASIFHRISDGPNAQSDGSTSLSVNHQGQGTLLKAMLQHSATVGLIDKAYRDVFVEPALATDYSHGATRAARHLNQATLDWTRAATASQWGMGIDLRDQADDIDNYQAAVDPLTGAETPDGTTTNGYTVQAKSAAAYLTDSIKAGQWEALLGARAERTALRVGPAAAMPTTHWNAFNPSLHLRYALGATTDLTLNYRRSLQMPDPRDFNPFTTYIDAQNLSRGNPALKPQHSSAWEVGSNLDAPRLTGSLGAFYRTSRDTVLDARSVEGDVLVTSKQNGGRARSAGLTASIDWTPDAALHLGADGGVAEVRLATPDLAALVHQQGRSAYLNLRAAYRIGRDDLALDAHGQSAGIAPLGRFGATSSVNLTWKHPFNKTLSLTVNANDLFDGSQRGYSTAASTFRQTGYDHFVARRLYVGLVKKIE
jgi:outer membrane receptor protein involved in Fe transport